MKGKDKEREWRRRRSNDESAKKRSTEVRLISFGVLISKAKGPQK
jgi:hypothetical protein